MNIRIIQLHTLAAALAATAPAFAQPFTIDWSSIDGGGSTTPMTGGSFAVVGTIGQPDAGTLAGGTFACFGGFWAVAVGGPACYANCDGSTLNPVLTANDFQCFLNKFASSDPYANCDGSTVAPALTANDFQCFLNAFAAGCS